MCNAIKYFFNTIIIAYKMYTTHQLLYNYFFIRFIHETAWAVLQKKKKNTKNTKQKSFHHNCYLGFRQRIFWNVLELVYQDGFELRIMFFDFIIWYLLSFRVLLSESISVFMHFLWKSNGNEILLKNGL